MPPSRVNRPSALELSGWGSQESNPLPEHPAAIPQKRKAPEGQQSEGPRPPTLKQRILPNVDYYKDPPGIVVHNESNLDGIDGEEPGAAGEDELRTKPVRFAMDFALYDRNHQNEFMLISALEEDYVGRSFAMAAYVTPCFEEEDIAHDEVLEVDPDEVQYVVLEGILGFNMDFTSKASAPYIETENAWYILKKPSTGYKPYWQNHFIPRRIAQLCICKAIDRPMCSYRGFLTGFLELADPFGRSYEEADLQYSDVILELYRAIQDLPNSRTLRSTPFIHELLSRMAAPRSQSRRRRAAPLPIDFVSSFRNPDIALLRPENQNPTQVTPRIAKLAVGFFQETLQVLGPQPRKQQGPTQKQLKDAWRRLRELVIRARKKGPKVVDYKKVDLTKRNSDYVKVITVGNTEYRVGETVIMPIGSDAADGKEVPDLPDPDDDGLRDKGIWDYFWFARIVWLNYASKRAHIQWYNHSSATAMQGFGDNQELFLQDHCDTVYLDIITAKVVVHYFHKTVEGDHQTPFGEFFCKMMYDPATAQYTAFTSYPGTTSQPPNNCPVCALAAQEQDRREGKPIQNGNGVMIGISINDQKVHLNDFILYHGDKVDGPARIGQVYELKMGAILMVRRFGRISQVQGFPDNELRDERHLFATTEIDEVSVRNVVRIIYVVHSHSLQTSNMNIDEWTLLSPDHFYVTYMFRRQQGSSWAARRQLRPQEVSVCTLCTEEKMEWLERFANYQAKRRPLFTLDLFGGAGALGVGMSAVNKCLKVKYAIELTPSAAQTYRKNSPETAVCNQCTNIALQYIIKKNESHDVDVPLQLFDSKTPIPQPPGPKEVDVILAGLPCQPHSNLNMFKRADDRKSNLLLSMLSYVDFYSPSYLFVENVPGFLRYSLNATQKNKFTTEGGIAQGGLQLMLRALTDMNYQLRFALLQAGHYGSPQNRIRFILIASKIGRPLPQLPQPTHDFVNVNSLPVRLANDHIARPIMTTRGRALHPAVTIADAISDMPRWDWQHPKRERRGAYQSRRDQGIPAVPCKISEANCGGSLHQGVIHYHHAPRSRYQKEARMRETANLQHFTKCLIAEKVQRTVEVPLIPKADFKLLSSSRQQYQTDNPESWVARRGYRPGQYGRLDPDGFFPTTVTNVDPTAKQSWVLNPWCHRMISVRELARTQGFPDWFIFMAIKDDVRTHRMIGNAVPFPLSAALGRELFLVDFKLWMDNEANAIVIE